MISEGADSSLESIPKISFTSFIKSMIFCASCLDKLWESMNLLASLTSSKSDPNACGALKSSSRCFQNSFVNSSTGKGGDWLSIFSRRPEKSFILDIEAAAISALFFVKSNGDL